PALHAGRARPTLSPPPPSPLSLSLSLSLSPLSALPASPDTANAAAAATLPHSNSPFVMLFFFPLLHSLSLFLSLSLSLSHPLSWDLFADGARILVLSFGCRKGVGIF